MAAPSTADALLDLVRKSGVVDPARLDAFREALVTANEVPDKLNRLARRMVQDGLLTNFQAEQLLKGKHRGFTLGNYKVLERIGRGGMGTVFLAEHQTMRHRVAVKVLPTEQARQPAIVERFYREARAAAAISHPNLVRAFDIDCDNGVHYLVMEYVEGVNLQELVDRKGPLAVGRAANRVGQAAVGLHFAHEAAGLVHRDIKPSNLLLDRGGAVKVLDMGLARLTPGGSGETSDDSVTRNHNDQSILGTADYIAPEQAMDSQAADTRADVYSLGATLYFLLTGQPPFGAGSVTQKLLFHQIRDPRPVREVRPDVPEALAAVLEWMMVKDPAGRPQNPGEVARALAAWLEAPPPPPEADDIPRLCPALQGPAGVSGPVSTVHLGGRFPPPVRADADTPNGLLDTDRALPPRPVSAVVAAARLRGATPALAEIALDPPVAAAGVALPPWRQWLRRRRNLCAAVIAAVLGAFVGGGAWWVSHPDPEPVAQIPAPEKPDNGPGPAPAPAPGLAEGATGIFLFQPANGREHSVPTLRAALEQARPGDHILVRQEVLREQLSLDGSDGRGRGVLIEGQAPSGKPVRWRLPNRVRGDRPLLELRGVPGFRLRGFTLDGDNRLADLIVLAGRCPGLALEDLHLQGFFRGAVRFVNCAGSADAPVSLIRLRTTTNILSAERPSESALLFEAKRGTAPTANVHIRVWDCRFEGPYRAGVQIAGHLLDADFQHNRFYNVADGLLYRKADPPHRVELSLLRNTFHGLSHVLHFECLPLPDRFSRIIVRNNVFSKVNGPLSLVDDRRFDPETTDAEWIGSGAGEIDVGVHHGIPELVPRPLLNVTDRPVLQGYPFLEARTARFTLPANPANDGRFLRPAADSLLTHFGREKVAVGVPPEAAAPIFLLRPGTPARLFPSVREALAEARAGDRIEVRADVIEEQLHFRGDGLRGDGVTVAGAGPSGQRVVWRRPDSFKEGRPLIGLANVSGLLFEHFSFDGLGDVDELIRLSGPCPGVRFLDAEARGFRRDGAPRLP